MPTMPPVPENCGEDHPNPKRKVKFGDGLANEVILCPDHLNPFLSSLSYAFIPWLVDDE